MNIYTGSDKCKFKKENENKKSKWIKLRECLVTSGNEIIPKKTRQKQVDDR